MLFRSLAWAVVESENTESWTWFFERLKRAIPQVLHTTLISDRDKGLLAADYILGEQVTRLTCCFHLHQNLKRFRNVEHPFWPLTNSKSPNDFLTKMAELEELHAPAAEYLR